MDDRIRVVFLGNDAWSVPPLIALVDAAPRIEVVLVATRHPRPGRRGSGPVPTPVGELARRRGLPLLETPTVRTGSGAARLRDAGADLLVVVAYGELLPPEVLRLASIGAMNLHFSLLPRWRGAAPVQHAILAGDETTGVTTMMMDEGLDTGPILEQWEEAIRPDDDAGSLGARLSTIGGALLIGSIERLVEGSVVARAQTGTPTTAPRLTAPDRALDWSEDAEALVRRIRALAPVPGATTRFRGAPLKVLRAEPVVGSGPAGVLSTVDREGVVVAAGRGAVRLLEVAPAGRPRMSGADLARGSRLEPGERLG
jgi:methionyl-tRNA formyltransferase